MQNKERWQVLCVQAANEQDSQKLSELIEEIASLLQERDARLRAKRSEG
jgi:predicted site-specific integrase-resolvase